MADSHAYEAPLRVREFLLVSRRAAGAARWFCIAITSGRDVAILLLGFLHYYFNFRARQSHARREVNVARTIDDENTNQNSITPGPPRRFPPTWCLRRALNIDRGATRRRYCLSGKLLHARGIHGIGARYHGPIVRSVLTGIAYIFPQENYRALEFLTFTWTPANIIP